MAPRKQDADWLSLRESLKGVDGLISNDEALCLFRLARERGGNVVEIGSWKGKSTICLASGLKENCKGAMVWAIDPHKGLSDSATGFYVPEDTEAIFKANIARAKVDNIVTPLVMKSEDAARTWSKPVSLLFIDGSHEYEDVKLDFTKWQSRLVEGGIICFHDALYGACEPGRNHPGVRRLILEEVFWSRAYADIHFCGSMVYACKVNRQSPTQSIEKSFKLGLYYVVPLVLLRIRRSLITFLFGTHLFKPVKRLKDFIRKPLV